MVLTASNASGRTVHVNLIGCPITWIWLTDISNGQTEKRSLLIRVTYPSWANVLLGLVISGRVCAGQVKYGLEIMGIGLIDIDKHNCIILKVEQSFDNITLNGFCFTLNDWYLKVIERYKEPLHTVSDYIVADAFFSKNLFAQGLEEMNFHLVSRLRDDANLMYLSQEQRTEKKGRLK
ncbi:MAG: transposase [Bacteroidales bacterium]|nr:transposase [Bacteroidales bacterium]